MLGNGWTPLFVAAWSGHLSVVKLLLAHDANASAETTKLHLEIPAQSTARSVAEAKGHTEVAQLLRDTMAKGEAAGTSI